MTVTWADRQVELEVPGRVEYVGLVRMLVSSLADARRELDDGRLDDLRLAISEACNVLLDGVSGGEARLGVRWEEDDEALVLEFEGPGETLAAARAGSGLPDPEHLDEDATLPMELIRALVDDAEVAGDRKSRRLRLAMRCPPSANHG